MSDKADEKDRSTPLRREAERILAEQAAEMEDLSELSEAETRRLIHELRVHQVELEMQNEELRRVQLELEEARNRYADLYDFAPAGYVTISDKGIILEVNLTMADMLGTGRASLIGRPFSHFIAPESEDTFYFHRRELLEQKMPATCELELKTTDGTEFWAYLECRVVQDEDGNLNRIRAAISDTTDRKQAENELRKSESLHREAQRVAKIGHWELDSPSGTPLWSDEIFQIFGLDPRQSAPSFAAHANIIHEEDWGLLDRSIQELSTQGIPFDIEFRTLRTDEEIRWMHAIGSAEIDKDGNVTRMFGTAQDITDRKNAEEKLRQSKARLELATTATNIGHWD
ncbi:MAG: PAS domain S-box protein [Deltaproteobacteria bacterium]|nr:PAS domain S-box protein [Deltaproteobacteria bacterium]